jgi:8-oxo-dGTP pyrophosphatase MutT (NUDIX family)
LQRIRSLLPATTTSAAVLIPIVDRGDELNVLLTLRADDLKHHAGQISFPGGRLESADADATAAALRETEEEIGLRREFVEVLGRLPDHAVITGFRVTPVVGLVRLGFELVLDPTEVAGTFEAPLRHLLDPSTHSRRARRIGEADVETFELPWGSFNIWGATAGMLLTLRECLGANERRGD